MKIRIEIKNNLVNLCLVEKNNTLDRLLFPEERNLSEKLLPSIDALLKKNKLKPKQIKKMELKSDLGDSFTTYRIAKAVVEAFNFANSF